MQYSSTRLPAFLLPLLHAKGSLSCRAPVEDEEPINNTSCLRIPMLRQSADSLLHRLGLLSLFLWLKKKENKVYLFYWGKGKNAILYFPFSIVFGVVLLYDVPFLFLLSFSKMNAKSAAHSPQSDQLGLEEEGEEAREALRGPRL